MNHNVLFCASSSDSDEENHQMAISRRIRDKSNHNPVNIMNLALIVFKPSTITFKFTSPKFNGAFWRWELLTIVHKNLLKQRIYHIKKYTDTSTSNDLQTKN